MWEQNCSRKSEAKKYKHHNRRNIPLGNIHGAHLRAVPWGRAWGGQGQATPTAVGKKYRKMKSQVAGSNLARTKFHFFNKITTVSCNCTVISVNELQDHASSHDIHGNTYAPTNPHSSRVRGVHISKYLLCTKIYFESSFTQHVSLFIYHI